MKTLDEALFASYRVTAAIKSDLAASIDALQNANAEDPIDENKVASAKSEFKSFKKRLQFANHIDDFLKGLTEITTYTAAAAAE